MKWQGACIGIALAVVLICLAAETQADAQSVLLTEVETITLFRNRDTQARRTSPIPQLKCVGDRQLCHPKYQPSAVQCYNMGTDGIDVQWRCEAEFDRDVAFDAVHVSCEGFRDSDDPWVLEGSCGLEYRLKYTSAYYDRKEREEREVADRRKASYANTRTESNTSIHNESNWGFKWFFFACAILFAIVWCTKKSNRTLAGSAPAPAYRSTVDPSYAYGPAPNGPSFVDGVAVGAAAAGGPRHVIHNQYYTSHTHQYDSTPSYDSSSSYTSNTRSYSPPSSPKKDTHTSTGFGTTSRR